MQKTKHDPPLLPEEKEALRLRPFPKILKWAEKNLKLVSPGYVYPGPYSARPWQREIVDAPLYWDNVYEVGATQVGKSTNFDVIMYYYMAVYGLNGMVCYANTTTVDDVFKLRIKDMIEKNKVLRENWSGVDDDLTVSNLKLKNCLWRVASANNKNSLASFAAAIVIGSEVGKWQKKTWSPVLALRGRQGAFNPGKEFKTLLESSPFEVGDYLYQEVYKTGNVVVTPHYRCPYCLTWQEFTDRQIKVRDEKAPKTPEYIRSEKEKAVKYECVSCKKEITEDMRAKMSENVVWAAPTVDEEDFKQQGETVLADGTVKGVPEGGKRPRYDSITYNFNRLVDVSFTFYNCLASFFEARNDPQTLRTYENETMARWKKKHSGKRVELRYLESKKRSYYQYGERHRIPETVKILTFGGDTQDDGFYYVVVGWGVNCSSWLVRHGFLDIPIDPNENHQAVYLKFRSQLYAEPLRWSNGDEADFRFGLLDRGGHRAEDVDCICSHFPNIKPYIGLSKKDVQKPDVFKSEKGEWFLGQAEMLSDFTGTLLENEEMYFPDDVGSVFLDQVWRQFRESFITLKGIREERWIHDYLGPDHYRDAFNLAWAAAKIIHLDKVLFDPNQISSIKRITPTSSIPQNNARPKPTTSSDAQHARGSYFNRALGRRYR